MGFLKPGLKHIGLRYSPQGHALSLPRRMGRHAPKDKIVRPRTKCDFRFYSGIFTPKQATPNKKLNAVINAAAIEGDATPLFPNQQVATPISSSPSLSAWAGMLEQIELHHNKENSVRTSDYSQKGAFNEKAVQRPHKGNRNHHKNGQKKPKYLSTRISSSKWP